MSLGRKSKTEHAGAKNGRGHWGSREEAKTISKKLRRSKDKKEILEQINKNKMNIKPLSTKDELEEGFKVLQELRKDLTEERFLEIYIHAHKMNGYTLIGAFEENRLIAVMGYRTLFDFVRGKHLYIDDLVTTEAYRSKGVGAKLLAFAEEIAIQENCSVVRLCAHVDNIPGQKFYIREKWKPRAIAYQKYLI